jgi:hypothetical protein
MSRIYAHCYHLVLCYQFTYLCSQMITLSSFLCDFVIDINSSLDLPEVDLLQKYHMRISSWSYSKEDIILYFDLECCTYKVCFISLRIIHFRGT